MNQFDNKKFELKNKWQGPIDGSSVAVSVNINKWDLLDLPSEFRNNKSVIIAAVRRDCSAFKYASLELQNDSDVILATIELGTPSFMGKADDESVLSRSLEAISKHPHLFSSTDLNFLYVSKCNFPKMEEEVDSMGWYKKIFSDEAKHLRMMKRLYREEINIFMKRIREDDKYQNEQIAIMSKETKQKEEYTAYTTLRKEIEEMPIYQRWKKDVTKKCGGLCGMCGVSKNLEVHHRTSFHSILKGNKITSKAQSIDCTQLWDINNGEVLCKECHDKMESSIKRQDLMYNKQT